MKLTAVVSLSLALLGLPSAVRAGGSWVPLGPELINDGQAWPGRTPVTGRINVVAPNPENPLGDVWIGSATGGVWNGSVYPDNLWYPRTDAAASLAVGAIALDNCTQVRCETVWAGTGEDSIRRDTQYGRGILKGQWIAATKTYVWTLLGEDKFARGAITKIVLDPKTSGSGKVVFAALSTGETSNGSHSTVTTKPAGSLGIWRSKDGGQTWSNVLSTARPATDLEMDPQDPKILFAGVRYKGLFRSLDGGNTWQPMGNGIPAGTLAGADWPEIAVYRQPAMAKATLYTVLGACPHPHDKGPVKHCSPAIYTSSDGGNSWSLAHAAVAPPPSYGEPITGYASYTHALAIHPSNPSVLWLGGINLYKSTSSGVGWKKIGNNVLHPDHHQVVVFESNATKTGLVVYDVNDGGFFVGDGENGWYGSFQQGLAVTQFQSVSAAPKFDFVFGGTQDNGTIVYQGTDVWEHVDDGDAASTVFDLDPGFKLYDVYVGADVRRCSSAGLCKFNWGSVTPGLAADPNASWYPPLVQDPTASGGQHPLYVPTTRLYRSVDDGNNWKEISGALGGVATIGELAGIQNPVSAIAVAPSDPNRIYVGYYDGQVFTTVNGKSANPAWTKVNAGLPGRPVTSIAVHPTDDKTVLAAFAGLGSHSVFRSTTAGTSWSSFDTSQVGTFATASVNTLAIEPTPPHVVWAGTDDGVYSHADVGSPVSDWSKSDGLPNVAVYDLEIVNDGKVLYAATHGRGVWRLTLIDDLYFPILYEEACCGDFDPYQPAPYVSISESGFAPEQRCSLGLYEGTRLCGTSSLDADGATLSTDAHGFLVAEKAGYYTGRPVSWACYDGTCAGGVPYSRCSVSEVEVTCGKQSVRSAVHRAREVRGPASTKLGFTPVAGKGGRFILTPTLKKNGGLSVPLCAVEVSYTAGDSEERVLARALGAVSSDERCRRSEVQAVLTGSSRPGSGEDEGPVPFRLSLTAPEQIGVELLTEVTSSGPAGLTVGSYGVLRQQSRVVPQLAFAGRAGGGRVEVAESSPLGTCSFAVETHAGDTAETVAAALQRAFLDRPGRPVFQIGANCPARQNARDVHLRGAVLQLALGQQISVRSTDPGLILTLGSER